MPLITKDINASAYLLADHLDAMLATGEDLLRVHRDLASEPVQDRRDSVLGQAAAVQRFVEAVCTLELSLAMRGLMARRRADELRQQDKRVDMIAGLFMGGTAALADAADELGDWTNADFTTGNEAVTYLRSRAVIPADSVGLVTTDQLVVRPDFLVARRVELNALLDLAATFLDALELFYDLYEDDSIRREARTPPHLPRREPQL